MQSFLDFVRDHRQYFDAAEALSAVVSLVGWTLGAILLAVAWRRKAIRRVTVGPFSFQLQEAVEAAATAARAWRAQVPNQRVDLDQIRATVGRAFVPEVADHLIGKSILWVDDNPGNNELAVRALRKLHLNVEQVVSTEAALEAMRQRPFDLIISDMGRGENMRAGYELLDAVRGKGEAVPFLIFSSGDTPEFRREAAAHGAQLSTNDMLELIQEVIKHLGE